MPVWMSGHTKKQITPVRMPKTMARMGTKRVPAKKASAAGKEVL